MGRSKGSGLKGALWKPVPGVPTGPCRKWSVSIPSQDEFRESLYLHPQKQEWTGRGWGPQEPHRDQRRVIHHGDWALPSDWKSQMPLKRTAEGRSAIERKRSLD